MEIAIIGTGRVGGALGRALSRGHAVRFGSRDPERDVVRRLVASTRSPSRAALPNEAVAGADVVVIATPATAIPRLCGDLRVARDALVVDTTNPLRPGDGGPTLVNAGAGAHTLAEAWPDTHVVKTWNSVGAEHLEDPRRSGTVVTMPLCGSSVEGRRRASALVAETGFEPLDLGDLRYAASLEHLALLWVQSAAGRGLGRDIAWRLVRPT